MRALVTGGAGFIGHHLVRALVDRGADVVVLDNMLTGFASRLDPVRDEIHLIVGDIRDRAVVDEAMAGVDTVFHVAALPSVARSVADPVATNEINVGGTINVMEAAGAAGVRRAVVSGSSSVYGNSPTLPRQETQRPQPQSPYAVSKLAAEGYALAFGRLRGVEAVVLRYFNVFGPGQDPASMYSAVVPRFVRAALEGARPTVHGDGHQSRDFTFVENVVSANLLAAHAAEAPGEVMNIGCGGRYSVLDLLAAVGTAAGVDLEPEFAPPRPGDVLDSQADISRARAILGYEPKVGFHAGIERTVRSFQAAAAEAGAHPG
jgi:UDP-glucose 4-epimerase